MDAMCLVGQFLSETSLEEGTAISNRIEEMFPGRIKSPEIYSKVMLLTSELSHTRLS